MSLEQALAVNTAALNRLAEILATAVDQATSASAFVPVEAYTTQGSPAPADVSAALAAPTPTPTPTPTPAPAPIAAPAASEASSVTFADVSAAVVAAVRTHRADVLALLSDFGVTKASQLPEDKWLPFLAALTKVTS